MRIREVKSPIRNSLVQLLGNHSLALDSSSLALDHISVDLANRNLDHICS